jgi:hypothetical protein
MRSELPSFSFHELFECHAGNLKVLTDVRNFSCIRLEQLHRHNIFAVGRGFGDNKRVRIATALEQLLLFDVFLEVGHAIDFRDEGTFRGRRDSENTRCLLPNLEALLSSYPQLHAELRG